MLKKIRPYAVSVASALSVGIISALISADGMDLYSGIIQPPLSPPSVLFPIVWTVLYILMGISCATVYQKKTDMPDEVRSALTVYAVSLFLNFFWSIIFFYFRAFLFAFIWLLLLLAAIIITIIKYHRISPVAGFLQIPYLIWVTFAGYLNFAIYILN